MQNMIGKLEDILRSLQEMDLENKISAALDPMDGVEKGIEVLQDYLNKTNIRNFKPLTDYKIYRNDRCEISNRIKFSPEEMDKEEIKKKATRFYEIYY